LLSLKQARVLVTGASGRIGSQLVEQLLIEGAEVHVLTSKEKSPDFHKALNYHCVNWQSDFKVPLLEVDFVVHLSSQNSSYVANQNVARDVESNIVNTVKILESFKQTKSKPIVILIGSTSEYGLGDEFDENSITNPLTFYETAKAASQLYAKQFVREQIISRVITLRLGNVYGTSISNNNSDRGFLDKCIKDSLGGKDLTYFGTGEYFRDYIHVSDVTNAIITAIKEHSLLSNNVYNIGTGRYVTIKAVLDLVLKTTQEEMGISCNLLQREFPDHYYEIERRNSQVRCDLFVNSTSWKAKLSLEDGVRDTILAYSKGF
jgi:UDP-glucose 4-epimerase